MTTIRIFMIIASIMVPAAAWADAKRVALVIGNNAYQSAAALRNPRADATAVGTTLTQMGFHVDQAVDLSRRQMLDALLAFADRARGADVALLYFSGHGMQIARDAVAENYLVPIDASMSDIRRVEDETIPLARVFRELASARVMIVLLDACRDNPAATRMGGQGTKSVLKRGLERIPDEVGRGALIAFAAAAGAYADDGDGTNSPFAAALLRHLPTPGVDVVRVLERVADDVERATNGRQQPEVMSRLRRKEDIYLAGAARLHTPVLPSTGPAPIHQCDRLGQPARVVMGRAATFVDGLPYETFDAQATASACDRAMAEYPSEPRFIAYAARAAQKLGYTGEAFRLYRIAADRGSAIAQSNLGAMYDGGLGTERDEKEAFRLYQRAAAQGLSMGHYNLGMYYEKGKGVARNEQEAARNYAVAASAGLPRAQVALGVLYDQGRGVPQDAREAVRLFRLAVNNASSGDIGAVEGLFALATMYQYGRGIGRDVAEAVRLYRAAADKGTTGALVRLGQIYRDGLLGTADHNEAVKHFRLAMDKDDINGLTDLAYMYLAGLGVQQDDREATRLYKLGAARGNSNAQAHLAAKYTTGAGVDNNPTEAVRLARLSAQQDDRFGQRLLAAYYADGFGVLKDVDQAFTLFKKSAEQGDGFAQFRLGGMYETGTATKADRGEALRLYDLAAKKGITDAQKALERLNARKP